MAEFSADDLIECYRRGIFPMADARDDPNVFLVDPVQRGILPLAGFHVSRRLARTIRADGFEVRVDSDFAAVIAACAQVAPDRNETWINAPIRALCIELHARGLAHSVESWREGQMVGGLYGISLGGAFFGESMFSRSRDASKVALAHLVARLKVGGYQLLDAQFATQHLLKFGLLEVPRAEYQRRLARALTARGDFAALSVQGGGAVLQAISQAS